MLKVTFAQNIQVKGQVLDESGQAFPFVVIQIKGKKNVVHSNIDGLFDIDVNKKDKLIFSYVGYETAEIRVRKKDNYIIQLAPAHHKPSKKERRNTRRAIRKNGYYVYPD